MKCLEKTTQKTLYKRFECKFWSFLPIYHSFCELEQWDWEQISHISNNLLLMQVPKTLYYKFSQICTSSCVPEQLEQISHNFKQSSAYKKRGVLAIFTICHRQRGQMVLKVHVAGRPFQNGMSLTYVKAVSIDLVSI